MPKNLESSQAPGAVAAPNALDATAESAFWRRVGAVWRQLAGNFRRAGFSFEWHEWDGQRPLDWSGSFHSSSVEICLNLKGSGWVDAGVGRMDFRPRTTGFFYTNGAPLKAGRPEGEAHAFLSVEFSVEYLRRRLDARAPQLHPLLTRCLGREPRGAGISSVTLMTHRHTDLLKSLFHPPVLRSAQCLWYESKALEFAAEFFFSAEESELLCSRAKRVARERVERVKAILLENLAEAPSLEDLGKRVGCSHFYLSRTFSQETGVSISHWLREARLQKAAELLRDGGCNVTEAALEVGYSSLSHFSQAFHEKFGCCPGLYPLRTEAMRRPGFDGPTA